MGCSRCKGDQVPPRPKIIGNVVRWDEEGFGFVQPQVPRVSAEKSGNNFFFRRCLGAKKEGFVCRFGLLVPEQDLCSVSGAQRGGGG